MAWNPLEGPGNDSLIYPHNSGERTCYSYLRSGALARKDRHTGHKYECWWSFVCLLSWAFLVLIVHTYRNDEFSLLLNGLHLQ